MEEVRCGVGECARGGDEAEAGIERDDVAIRGGHGIELRHGGSRSSGGVVVGLGAVHGHGLRRGREQDPEASVEDLRAGHVGDSPYVAGYGHEEVAVAPLDDLGAGGERLPGPVVASVGDRDQAGWVGQLPMAARSVANVPRRGSGCPVLPLDRV